MSKFECINTWSEFKKLFKRKFETVGFHKGKSQVKVQSQSLKPSPRQNEVGLSELILKVEGLTDKFNVLLEKRSFKGEDGSQLLGSNACDEECSRNREVRPLDQFEKDNPFIKDEGGGYKTDFENSTSKVETDSCKVKDTYVDIEPLVEVKVLNKNFLALLWTGTSFSRIGPEIISLVSLLNIPVTKRLCLNHGIETLEDTVNLSIDFGGIKLKETFILTESMNYSLALGWNYMCFRNININSIGWSIGNPGDCPLQRFSVSTMCVSEGDVNKDVTGEEPKVHVSSKVTLLARDVSQCPPGRPLGTEVTSANTSSDMAGSTKYEFDSFDLEPEDYLTNDFEYRECDFDISFLFKSTKVEDKEMTTKFQPPKVYENQVQVVPGEIQSESSKLRYHKPVKRDRSKSPSTFVPFKCLKVDIPYPPLEILSPYPTDPTDLSFPCVKFRVFKKSKIKFSSGMSSVKRDDEFRKRKKLRAQYPPVKDQVLPSKYSLNGRLFSNCFKRSHFRQDIRVPWKLNQNPRLAEENLGIGTHCLKQTIHRSIEIEVTGSSRANLN
jgi:hypothetical protein